MIELTENMLQIVLFAGCLICSSLSVMKSGRKEWLLLSLFYASWLIGDIYWGLFKLFFHMTPKYFYVAEGNWYSSYLFLILVLRELLGSRKERRGRLHALASGAFVSGMCLFYMQWGDYFGNIASAVFMGILIKQALDGLLTTEERTENEIRKRGFYWTVLFLCLMEYALWTASCFWTADSLLNPYFWLDSLLSVSAVLLVPALRRAVKP